MVKWIKIWNQNSPQVDCSTSDRSGMNRHRERVPPLWKLNFLKKAYRKALHALFRNLSDKWYQKIKKTIKWIISAQSSIDLTSSYYPLVLPIFLDHYSIGKLSLTLLPRESEISEPIIQILNLSIHHQSNSDSSNLM